MADLDLSKLNIGENSDETPDPSEEVEKTTEELATEMMAPYELVAEGEDDEEAKYYLFKSSRVAMNMITDGGLKIRFTGYEFITEDISCADYLKTEIDKGLRDITFEGMVRSNHNDPVSALKRKFYLEFQEELKKKAIAQIEAGQLPNIGTLTSAGVAK